MLNQEEMAGGPEDAIQAILTGLLNMQQLNLSLADQLAVEALLEGEPQGERDQWGGPGKRPERNTWHLPETGRPSREAGLLGRLRLQVPRGGPRLRSHGGAGQEGVV